MNLVNRLLVIIIVIAWTSFKAKIWCGHTRVSPDYDNYPILSVAGQDRMHGNDHRKKQYLSVLQILFLYSEN